MVLKPTFVLAISLLIASCGSDSSSDNSSNDALSGQALYTQYCTICHGEDGKLGVSGASDLSSSKMSMDQVIERISKGKNAMPAMQAQLGSKQNVKKVAEYIQKLRK